MKKTALVGLALVLNLLTVGAHAQEFSVPEKPRKNAMLKKNIKINNRNPAGYLGIQSIILAPLSEGHYAVLYGSLAGKKNADSFHYFENEDLGFICKGFGRPTNAGGIVTNECFLNGGSTGKTEQVVPDYGKLSGRMLFNVYDQGELVGLAAMQWGLSYPNQKKLYKFLKANGG